MRSIAMMSFVALCVGCGSSGVVTADAADASTSESASDAAAESDIGTVEDGAVVVCCLLPPLRNCECMALGGSPLPDGRCGVFRSCDFPSLAYHEGRDVNGCPIWVLDRSVGPCSF
jgi:hypothetical protein